MNNNSNNNHPQKKTQTQANPMPNFVEPQPSQFQQEQPKSQAQSAQQPELGFEPQLEYNEIFPGIQKPVIEELVINWQAPSRVFKKHNRQYITTVITIVLFLSLILFFAGQILPIAVVIAVAFIIYVMGSIPPGTIDNMFTTYGIRSEDNLYYWGELGRFWFSEKFKQKILHVEVIRFPNRLTLLLGNVSEETIREILSEVLLEEEPALTIVERIAAWLSEKIPIDIDS